MVAADVKQIRGRDLDRIRNEGLAHHRRLRSGYGRFQQRLIANTSCATVGSEHFAVNRFDGLDRQMLERLAQERRLKSAAFFLIKRLAVVAAVSESIAGWMGVKTIEPPGWTVTFTLSPTLIRARSISAASKMMPWELPTFVMVLIIGVILCFTNGVRQPRNDDCISAASRCTRPLTLAALPAMSLTPVAPLRREKKWK